MAVFTVTLSGGGPWGLRLIGGHSDPLLIARLRKRSKAEDAGLQENDTLVSINGQPCNSMTHATAMTMLENSSHITLEVARSGGGGYAAPAAVPSLGPAAPSAGDGQRISSAQLQLQTAPQTGMVNSGANIRSYQTDDGGMHTVKESTSQQQFGSSSVTKVSREVTSNYGPRIDTQGPQGPQGLFSPAPSPRGPSSPYQQAPSPRELFSPGGAAPPAPYQQPPPQNFPAGPQGGAPYGAPSPRQMFSPAPQQNTAPQPGMLKNPGKPGRANIWQPGAGSAGTPEPSTGPSMPPPQKPLPSIGPKFNVRNMSSVTTQEAYGSWAPGGKNPPKVSPRPMTPPRDEPVTSGPGVWEPSKAKFRDILDSGPKEPPVNKAPPSYVPNGAQNNFAPVSNGYGAPNSYGSNMPDSQLYGHESDMHRYPDNPDTLPNIDMERLLREGSSEGSGTDSPRGKKKIFADSAFYDDPQHKYPTIEEQIKMARKVALSLTSPANKRARGHQMFNKRREKSDTWSAGMDMDEEVYYNPDPWSNRSGPHTWQPDPVRSYPSPSAPTPLPPSNIDRWMAPSYKDYGAKEEKTPGSLSAEEFERMRLYEQKTLHNTVSPQLCFNLANDLRNAKGKAGQMFAKRRARADEHVIDESNVRGGPDPNIMAKLLEGRAPAPAPKADLTDNKKNEVYFKPEVSPWEAAAVGGTVDTAFNHLNKGLGSGGPVPDKFNTQTATKLEQGGGIGPLDGQNFNRRARGWGAMGGGGPASSAAPTPPPQQQWPSAPQQQWSGYGASAPGPPSQWGPGAGAAAAPQQQYGAPAQPSGFSDL